MDTKSFNITPWMDFLEQSIVIGKDFKIIYIVIMCVIIVISLSANLLICVVIYFDRNMHTVTNYYLFSLALSDVTLTCVLLFAVYEVFDGSNFSETTCKIQYFGVISLWNYSTLTITALSIERYIAICHPLKTKAPPKLRRVIKIIAFMWLVAAAETAPEMLTISMIPTQPLSCFTVPTVFARVVNGVLAILTFFIPLIIITSTYFMIIIKVNLRRKIGGASSYRTPRGNLNKMIVAISVAFVVCWTPHFIIRVLVAVLDPMDLIIEGTWWIPVFKVLVISGWFCVILNPIIFSLATTKFRRAVKGLWNSKNQWRQN